MRTMIAAACLTVLACASSGKDLGKGVQVQLVQVTGPAQMNYPTGAFDVQYGIRVVNSREEPVTLRQIYLEPTSKGGPYEVLREHYYFKQVIAAGSSGDLAFWANARATGNAFSIDAQAPVSIRATAYFDSASGSFNKVVMANLPQTLAGRR